MKSAFLILITRPGRDIAYAECNAFLIHLLNLLLEYSHE